MNENTSKSDNDSTVLHWSQRMRETGWTIDFDEGQGPDDPRPFLYIADIEYGEYLATRPSFDSITNARSDSADREFVHDGKNIDFQSLCNALGSALADFGAAGSLHAETSRYLVASIALAYFVRTKPFRTIQDTISRQTGMIVFRIPAPDGVGHGILRPLINISTDQLMTATELADTINHFLSFDRHNHPDWFPSSGAIVDFRPRARS